MLVEAAYNANMPFKWNATRIQVLPNQRAGPGGPGSGAPPPTQSLTASTTLNTQVFTNAGGPQGGHGLLPKPLNVPPPIHPGQQQQQQQQQHHQPRGGGGSNDFTGPRDPFGNPRGMNSGGSGRQLNSSPNRSQSSVAKSSDKPDRGAPDRGPPRRGAGGGAPREERRVERSRELSRDKERSRGSPPPATSHARKRSRSPVRTRSRSPRRSTPSRSRSPRSPPRRRARTTPRYNVSVPKISLNFPESNVFDLKHRYSHM